MKNDTDILNALLKLSKWIERWSWIIVGVIAILGMSLAILHDYGHKTGNYVIICMVFLFGAVMSGAIAGVFKRVILKSKNSC